MNDLRSANSHLGTKNVITKKEFIPLVQNTVEDINSVLTRSCGRNSRYGLVISPEMNQYNDIGSVTINSSKLNIFSKDGAHLTQSIQYASPIQTYIKNILVYIGDRVDSACGDGTTTSMMLSGNFLLEMLHFIDNNSCYNKYSTTDFTDQYDKFIELLSKGLDEFKITVDQLQKDFYLSEVDAVWLIAYLQSYTASNGDKEIASAVAEAFSHLPIDNIDTMYQVYPEMERDKKIEVVIDDAQFIIEDPGCVTPEILNENMMSEYSSDDNILIVIPQGIPDQSLLTTTILQYIVAQDPKQHITIISRNIGQMFIDRINQMNTAENRHIGLFVHGNSGGRFSSLPTYSLALCGVMNKPVFARDGVIEDNFDDYVCKHVKCHYTRRYLKLYNLYTPLENYKGHPGIKHPEEYPHYHQIRTELHANKQKIMDHHHKHKHELDMINEALTAIEHTHKVKIVGGGRTYDQLAIRLVIEDCIASSISALTHGLHFNGMYILHNILRYDHEHIRSNEHPLIKLFQTSLINACLPILYRIFETSSNNDDPMEVKKDLYNKLNSYRTTFKLYSYLDSNIATMYGSEMELLCDFTNQLKDFSREEIKNLAFVPPTQPCKLFSELFVRMKEVILKTILSDHIVTIGEVFNAHDPRR